MRIIGLDLSLTATGIAIHDTEQRSTVCATVGTTGKAGATLADRGARLDRLEDQIFGQIGEKGVTLAVIEAPAFSRTVGHQHDRSGLWWRIVTHLSDYYCPVAEVTPGTLKRYITGKGSAGKDQVVIAATQRWPGLANNNNEVDALGLCYMGARYLGHPLDSLPKHHLAAMDAVHWPEAREAS